MGSHLRRSIVLIPDACIGRRAEPLEFPARISRRSPLAWQDRRHWFFSFAWSRNMYESRLKPPLPLPKFLRRVVMHGLFAVLLLVLSLLLGIAGYGYFERLPWRDGFLNSAMLLGGMGPVDATQTSGGKLFAGS